MMKRSRAFQQTSTPISSEQYIERSPPSFKRLSIIPPIDKKRYSRLKIRNSNLRRRLVTSDRNSLGNSTDNGADGSQQEASSALHSVLFSKMNSIKTKRSRNSLQKSIVKKRSSISEKVHVRSQSCRKNKIPRKRCSNARKGDVNLDRFSFETSRKSWSKRENTNELEITTKKIVERDDFSKMVSGKTYAKITSKQELEKLSILKHDISKGFNATENVQNILILKTYLGLNVQKEISICDIVSYQIINELYQKPSSSFIRKRSEEQQKECLRPNKLEFKTNTNKKRRKCINQTPSNITNERVHLAECSKEDEVIEILPSAENVTKVANKFGTNEMKKSETGILNFTEDFCVGLEWHLKQISKPEIAKDNKNDFSCNASSIDSITSLQSSYNNDSCVGKGILSKKVSKNVEYLGSQNNEINNDQTSVSKQIDPSRKEQSEDIEIDAITKICTNSNYGSNERLSGTKEKLDFKNGKKTLNLNKVKSKPCQRKPKLRQLNISGSKPNLLDDTFSYPSTSTPFDSPEVQTRRLSSVIRNLSPVIEEQANTNAYYLNDIEPTLNDTNKTYGKDRYRNSATQSTRLSKSERLWLSMTKSASETNSDYTTSNYHSALSQSDKLWLSMMKSSNGADSTNTAALTKTNEPLLEKSKPDSKTGKDPSEITLFESPPKESVSEISGKDHGEILPTKVAKKNPKLVKVKRDSQEVIKTNNSKVKNTKETRKKDGSKDLNKTTQSLENFDEVSKWSLCIEPVKIRPYSTFYH